MSRPVFLKITLGASEQRFVYINGFQLKYSRQRKNVIVLIGTYPGVLSAHNAVPLYQPSGMDIADGRRSAPYFSDVVTSILLELAGPALTPGVIFTVDLTVGLGLWAQKLLLRAICDYFFSDPLKPEEIRFAADGGIIKVAFNKPIIRHVENLLRAVERNNKDQAVY